MKTKQTKHTTPAPAPESTALNQADTPQSSKPQPIVPNIAAPTKQKPSGFTTTTPIAAFSTEKPTPQMDGRLNAPADGATEDEAWKYISAEAILYCEGLGFNDYSIDVGEAFPIRLQHAHDILAQMDYSRPIVTLVPIQIHLRMKKADADGVDNAKLYQMLKDELYRLSNELPNLRPGSIGGDEILRFVTAVSLSDLIWSDEPHEDYAEHLDVTDPLGTSA